MNLASKNPLAGAIAAANRANSSGVGASVNPILPGGLGGPKTTGAPESSGGLPPALGAAFAKLSSSGGGGAPRGLRGPEKPSVARSSAISRRLNGKPSRGSELKGL